MAKIDFEENYNRAREDVLRIEKELQNVGIYHGWPLGDPGKMDYPKSYDFMEKFVADDAETKKTKEVTSENNPEKQTFKVRASWELSRHWRGKYGDVIILELENGRIVKKFNKSASPTEIRAVMAWNTSVTRYDTTMREAEEKALKKLRTMIHFYQWHCYFVDGTFLEPAKSGVTYQLRKGRPTLAFRDSNFLCALCFHSLAYYKGTWAGALCPTDEVISHLLMIRGGEKLFWRKANQISMNDPRSGI